MAAPTRNKTSTDRQAALRGDTRETARIARGDSHEPHRVLGAHPAAPDGGAGVVVRAFHPDAVKTELLLAEQPPIQMEKIGRQGLFGVLVPNRKPPMEYRLRFSFADGTSWERDDPYRFLPTVGELDLHLFNEGSHRRLWEALGARRRTVDGVEGVAFSVWAPNAKRVSVVGEFCNWDGRLFPMRSLGSSGVWELFVPNVGPWSLYKYEIKTQSGELRIKSDPMAFAMEMPSGTASRVFDSQFEWGDQEWMARRSKCDPLRAPIAIYELHLGSWMRTEDGRPLNYREIAPRLVEHVKRFGFTHVEPLPLAEHPFDGSWGYQVSGYYAPTARYGSPDDFRYFVDYCHRHEIGVIVDWVPAHFPKDDFALARFDGTALYEHEDPRLGEHPDWGTLIFNYGRNEVRNFLTANALYWLNELHVDGLRVDAVASMLYLDYSRKAGEWIPNRYGGRENIEAIQFLQSMNETVRAEAPGAIMVAEESTAWGGVSRPAGEGGLGFTFKWNMGWMHDTLEYFSKDPIHRRYHHNELTFAAIYEHTERFIMPLSHDEVVHGKGALLCKMPGDPWRQFANLRTLLAYQYTRPGKKLLFMGTELAPWCEWNHHDALDWSLAERTERAAFQRFLEDLGRLYREHSCLWRTDPDADAFSWIDCHDCDNSVLSFLRRDGESFLVVVLNLTPVPRDNYRIGVPRAGGYVERMNTDALRYGGSEYPTDSTPHTDAVPWHGQSHSLHLNLPPLGVVVLAPA
ncbi:MAG: 1,4-alpha-glucan branching protein GlgB [Planctomycetes bacterium]|nr:1,4-alpha-glucan branching protein GlgB [Planctomycetota bacterium]